MEYSEVLPQSPESSAEEPRACVECGVLTVNTCYELFAQGKAGPCYAEDRIPSEDWALGQRTPICAACEDRYEMCRFCRQQDGCSPQPWKPGQAPHRVWVVNDDVHYDPGLLEALLACAARHQLMPNLVLGIAPA